MSDLVKKKSKRVLTGKIISNKMNKTVTALIKRYVRHPLYEKIIVKTNKYHVHNDLNHVTVGDIVEIQETRPISKTKMWKIIRIVKTGATI